VKPSPYFIDTFRYFFKRFSSEESLRNWFLKRAGGESGAFYYPEKLTAFKQTLVFLPTDPKLAILYIRTCKQFWNKKTTLIVAHDSLREALLREEHPAEITYLDTKSYRFGEPEFINTENRIQQFKPELCLYFGDSFLPSLYLARHSNATCRIGFEQSFYPFLNICLVASDTEKATLLTKLYGGVSAK